MAPDRKWTIDISEIPDVFSGRAVTQIAANAGLSLVTGPDGQAAVMRLASDVRASVGAYVLAKPRPSTNCVRREILGLALAAEIRDYEALVPMWTNLSDDIRHLLQIRADATRHMVEDRARGLFRQPENLILTLPMAADLRDPERQTWACDVIFRLCVVGRGVDHDWSNSEGQAVDTHHHDPTALRLHVPAPTRKDPSRDAERLLLQSLEIDCYAATGRMPPKSGRHTLPGPIDRFIAAIFQRCRAPTTENDDDRWGLVVRLRNEIGPLREKAMMSQRLRELLDPLRQEDHLIDEVRSSLARGEGEVLQIPAGSNQGAVPAHPAIIAFEETGTICFLHPLFGHRTVAVEAALRARIIRSAERLALLNARDRHMRDHRRRKRSARGTKGKVAPDAAQD